MDPITGAILFSAGSSLLSGYLGSQAADRATNIQEQQLQFAQQQYQDWQDVFGDTQKNLASFYQGLSPESFSSAGIQNLEKAFGEQQTRLQQTLSQKGLSDSSIAGRAYTDLASNRALAEAQIRQQAPMQVAQAKQGFLGLGMGQQQQALGAIGQAQTNLANIAMGESAAYGQAAGSLMGTAGTLLGTKYGVDNA